MTKKIKWRLGNLPSPDEVITLVKEGLLTKEQGREILFTEQEDTARDTKSLESEIKFLRELVERLSKDKSKVVETIRIIKGYDSYPWYQPYYYWCGSVGNTVYTVTGTGSTATNAVYNLTSQATSATSGLAQQNLTTGSNTTGGFSSISTW